MTKTLTISAFVVALVVALVSCGSPGPVHPTTALTPVVAPKPRFTIAFRPRAVTPDGRSNIYLSDLHDKETGRDYLIIQESGHGLVVLPLEPAASTP